MTRKSVFVIPSWYASKAYPTSGSFFREQALLMEEDYDISVIWNEKVWISRQRFLYQKYFGLPQPRVSSLEIFPPHGHVVHYPFCKYASEEDNLRAETESYLRFLDSHPQTPQLIHAHSAYKGGVLAQAMATHLGIPYIITEHYNPFLLHSFSKFWQKKIRESLENATHVLAVSEHQRQNLLMHALHCNPITVGNLVDDQAYHIVPNEPEPDTGKVRLLITTYYPNFIKDMDTFFGAMEILKNRGKSNLLECTVIGGGELSGAYHDNHYTEEIRKRGLESFVSVIPSASREEMPKLVQRTHAFVSSSIAESFGVAICEAMLCGKPVITTLNGGVNDYANETNSIRVRVHDAEALASGILEFLEQRHRFDATEIRNSILSKYGHVAFRSRIKDIYEQAMNGKN